MVIQPYNCIILITNWNSIFYAYSSLNQIIEVEIESKNWMNGVLLDSSMSPLALDILIFC